MDTRALTRRNRNNIDRAYVVQEYPGPDPHRPGLGKVLADCEGDEIIAAIREHAGNPKAHARCAVSFAFAGPCSELAERSDDDLRALFLDAMPGTRVADMTDEERAAMRGRYYRSDASRLDWTGFLPVLNVGEVAGVVPEDADLSAYDEHTDGLGRYLTPRAHADRIAGLWEGLEWLYQMNVPEGSKRDRAMMHAIRTIDDARLDLFDARGLVREDVLAKAEAALAAARNA